MKFMLRSLLLVVLVCISGAAAIAQTSGIVGTLTDEKGNPLPSAQITATQGGISRGGTVTNFDGEYTIKPLEPGRYDVIFKWQNFQQTITGVIVNSTGLSTVNNKLNTTQELSGTGGKKGGIIVRAARQSVPPLVDFRKPGGSTTKTSEMIEKAPTTNIADVASLSTQAYQSRDGGAISLSGGRSTGTQYVIDGMIVAGGSTNPVQGSVDQVTTYVSGIPAKYGDASGGLVAITTKGATPTIRGGIRLQHSVDGYNNNLGAFNLTGPLLKRRMGDSTSEKRVVLGFGLNGEGRYAKDATPSYNKIYVLNDATQNRLNNTPLVVRPDANGISQVNYASDNIRKSDMEAVKAKPNASSYGGKLNGKLIYSLNDRVNITLGGEAYGSKGNNFNQTTAPFNSQNNSQTTSFTGRGYIRFSQRFSNPSVDAEKGKVNSISNAFYTVQADYQKAYDITQDKNHKQNTFNYGYVGKFDQQFQESYAPGYDSLTGAFGIRRVGYSPTGYTFQRSEINPLLANYTSQYMNLTAPQNRQNRITIGDISHGLVRNGESPASVYGLWTNAGSYYGLPGQGGSNSGWNKQDQTQVAFQVDASFDLKQGRTTHSIEFGLYYQQRNERSYSIVGASMWEVMRLLQGRVVDGSSVDYANPTFIKNGVRYTKEDVKNGVFTPGPTDTILYDRAYNAANSTAFDRNLRAKLGYTGTARAHDYINIDNLDPSTFSMNMFTPDELVVGGSPIVNYYGYDYTGKRINGQVNFNDYFTQKNDHQEYMRPIGAYRPNYIAGYISDYIQYKDFLISLGVRIDRFDANTKVLKDPYSFVPTKTAGNVTNVKHPSNIGSDYVVYVGENTSPNPTIIGYRNGETWYDAGGNEVQDPTVLRTGTNSTGLQPYLQKDPVSGRVIEIQDTAYRGDMGFTDYKPQVNAMPRINFSFKLNEDALFYAHYDVVVQRPTSGNFATAQDYYYLINRPSISIGNPDLKPEKRIDYEVGFQQRLGSRSAVTLSAFYQERRNQIQIRQYYQAYPTTYLTFGNRDFSTYKGFSLAYELRRTGNISATINYTLSFNEGTGSSAASNQTLLASLIQAGYPNQRNLFPVTSDSRHNINATIDYRYQEKEGPTIGGVHFLENAGAQLIFRARSGEPYTRYAQPQPRAGNGVNLIAGTVNGSRLPWHAMFNLNIDKNIPLTGKKKADDLRMRRGLMLNVFFYVQNLLNTRDVLGVYGYTGRAGDDGYLTSAQGINFTATQTDPQAYKELYNLREQDINQLNSPRTMVLGIKLDF